MILTRSSDDRPQIKRMANLLDEASYVHDALCGPSFFSHAKKIYDSLVISQESFFSLKLHKIMTKAISSAVSLAHLASKISRFIFPKLLWTVSPALESFSSLCDTAGSALKVITSTNKWCYGPQDARSYRLVKLVMSVLALSLSLVTLYEASPFFALHARCIDVLAPVLTLGQATLEVACLGFKKG